MEEEFFGRLQSLGKPKAKKKRGGIAGLWDRNKGAIGSIAGAALGNLLLPGAGGMAVGKLLGGAAGGALARGRLDTKNVLGDVLTGTSALGAGKILGRGISAAQSGSGNIGAMARDFATAAGGETRRQLGMAPPGYDEVLRGATGTATATAGGTAGKAGMTAQAPARGLNRALQFVEKNPTAVGMGLQALSGVMSAQEERRIEEARLEEERRRSRNLGMLAAPIFRETFGGSR